MSTAFFFCLRGCLELKRLEITTSRGRCIGRASTWDRGEKTPGWDRSGCSGVERGGLRAFALIPGYTEKCPGRRSHHYNIYNLYIKYLIYMLYVYQYSLFEMMMQWNDLDFEVCAS